MANYTTNLKAWGSSGAEYPTGYKYSSPDPPIDAWDNFLINNLITDVKDHLIPLTNSRIETDYGGSAGQPASPETAHLYADTDNNTIQFWDGSQSSWRNLLFADGDTLEGVIDANGNKIYDTSGRLKLGDAKLLADLVTTDGELIWDESAGYIPQSRLQNDSLTVAGNSVSLGSSTSISHSDITNIGQSDHHTRYADTEAVDAVNAESSLSVNISGNANTVGNRTEDEVVATPFVLPRARYEAGQSNVEVWRLNCQSGEQLEVRRVDLTLAGGGSSTNVSLDLYDVANNTSLVGDTNAGSVTKGSPIATSQAGATIIARLTNSSGSQQDVTATIKANIIE